MSISPYDFEPGCQLVDLYPEQNLWRYWLLPEVQSSVDLPSSFRATDALRMALTESPSEGPNAFNSGFFKELAKDLKGFSEVDVGQDLIQSNLNSLASGTARAVVTGQQPGFGGGPLYSLFKIATTIALAQMRTAKGLPSVPVFWMGDDDDDLAEALDPVLWNGQQGCLQSSHCSTPGGKQRQKMIGHLAFDKLEIRVSQVLDSMPHSEELKSDILAIYKKAETENLSLSDLTQNLVQRIFRGSGLVVLRGNDSRLHQHSASFYERIIPRLPDLARLTGLKAKQLATELGITSLDTNSLNRPLYRVEGQFRIPWDGAEGSDDSSRWRCGVLLRSLLQDWLLKPAAVVVGPGELTYLSQLTAAYDFLDIPRAPLIPRLFGWLVPEDLKNETISQFNFGRPLDRETAQSWALSAGLKAEKELVDLLTTKLDVTPERAQDLAVARTRRWVKGAATMLQNESQKRAEEQKPKSPAWVFPEGKRQERKLCWVPCAATWGQGLINGVLAAASEHLQMGLSGQWKEFYLQVPEPAWWSGKGENR